MYSQKTIRRFILGRQGLWPGRRWNGKEGTAQALYQAEAVQMDPLNVVARSHDLVLWSRVTSYQPEHLDSLLYRDRLFFDYGGALFIYPIQELPYWRTAMRRREAQPRWAAFASQNQLLLDEVRMAIKTRGPLGNRDFSGRAQVNSYRGRKDSALALYYLWLTGELMIHHREGFDRVYDFRDHIAPPEWNTVAPVEEAEEFFARKTVAFAGLLNQRSWRNHWAGFIERPVSQTEAAERFQSMVNNGELAPIEVEGWKGLWFVLSSDLPVIDAIEQDTCPSAWNLLETSTQDEVVFLAPLEIVSARGRAAQLFNFEYIWEVYKPAANRRWGYYTLPILWQDSLVGRVDPKLDRKTATLVINGFWLEEPALGQNEAFVAALARGFIRFASFLKAGSIGISGFPAGPWMTKFQKHILENSTLKLVWNS